ncbi:MAG TPA: M48 family metalloprotease [candidate division Zixibacteria bacterium]|nr:M48 family metalloprotease [candidate division Zixibacteria bacterium]
MRQDLIRKGWFPAFLFLLPILLYAGCTTGVIPATGEKRYLGYSWEQEVNLGRKASKEVAAAFGLYRDPGLERYVEEVGRRVLARSHLRRPETDPEIRNTPVTFQILDSPVINAMALPGGHIYVTRGMLAHLNSEDQLASVLAHEIGHVSARHASRQAWQQQLGQGLLLGGALIGQIVGLPAEQILNLGGAAAQLIFLRYSREDELEADRLGVEYTSLAGYDPTAVTGLFESLDRMQEKEGQGLPNFLSTHPNPGDRIARIRQWSSGRRSERPRDGRYFDAIDGMVLGEDPRHGFVERDVFYHPDLRFRFPVPRGFRVVNQPAQVIMVEGARRAILGFASSPEKSPEAAAARFARQGGLRVLDNRRARSNGLPAVALLADAKMQNGRVARLLAYFVEFGGNVYHFVGYTSPEAFGAFRGVFLRTMEGFGELRDPAMLSRQPVRLATLRVSRPARFRALIPRGAPGEMTPEDLAILNQVRLDQMIEPGTVLKFPRSF